MKDLHDVKTQLERALDTLVDAAEQEPDEDLAEAVDHVSAALTRLRAAEGAEETETAADDAETGVAPWSERFGRKTE